MIYKRHHFYSLLLLVLVASGFQSDEPTRYFLHRTLPLPVTYIEPFTFDFNDDLLNDTLFQARTQEGLPVYYHRKLNASVCFDDKCRLLDVTIYWNPTGRYLGFELPPKEYLSKSDHEPFTTDEYLQINQLLADEQSPLGNMSYEELVPKAPFSPKGVDAVTSATAKNVLDYIVKGAAFTTYKMWHFIYGQTREKVVELTIQSLSPGLIERILETGDASDKLWALNHINGHIDTSPAIINQLLKYINNGNYSLSERAIHAINAKDLQSDSLQLNLLVKYNQVDYSLKKLLLRKINDAPFLNEQVKNALNIQLPGLSADLVADVLNLYQKFGIKDIQTCRTISQLLRSENRFTGTKAMQYLEHIQVTDKDILKEIALFKSRLY